MGKTLYLECESGISGDMTVAALLDLGADQQVLKKALASLPVQGFDIRISRVKKSGLDACDFDVVLDKEHENHDHDMEYLHGHTHAHNHGTEHMHGHDVHNYDAEYIHEHHGADDMHEHEHRSFADILQIIESSSLSERAKKTSADIFSVLADAEAKAHGVPKNQVHFHEVGAVDSIVDILSVAVCLDNLDIDQVIVTELSEGRGTVRCQHGILPIPVPAVANIVQANHLRLKLTQVEGELVTPTGAAIVAAVRTSDKLPESFFIEKTGKYKGYYHVLNGLISPIDGKNPEDLNITNLINNRINEDTKEIIIALNPSIEGEITSQYIQKILEKYNVKVSRLSYGLPMGTDIEYLDPVMIAKAWDDRKVIS